MNNIYIYTVYISFPAEWHHISSQFFTKNLPPQGAFRVNPTPRYTNVFKEYAKVYETCMARGCISSPRSAFCNFYKEFSKKLCTPITMPIHWENQSYTTLPRKETLISMPKLFRFAYIIHGMHPGCMKCLHVLEVWLFHLNVLYLLSGVKV